MALACVFIELDDAHRLRRLAGGTGAVLTTGEGRPCAWDAGAGPLEQASPGSARHRRADASRP